MDNPYSASETDIVSGHQELDFSKVPIQILYIIFGALIVGILFYAGFSVSTADRAKLAFDWAGVNWYLEGLMLVAMIAASFVAPVIAAKASANSPYAKRGGSIENDIFGQYQVQFIVGLAFLDACAFYFIFRFSSSANLAYLALAAVAVFIMGMRFPSRSKMQAWWMRNQPQI